MSKVKTIIRVCQHCKKEYDFQDAERIYGKESLIVRLNMCSAKCYTDRSNSLIEHPKNNIPAYPLIELTDYEKKWILACKGQLKEQYPHKQYWHETLKPLWTEIYSWNPDEDNNYKDYLKGLFNKLLGIMLKIKTKWSSENGQLEDLFQCVFEKKWSTDDELPIKRGIQKLCSLIASTEILNHSREKRFDLTIK